MDKVKQFIVVYGFDGIIDDVVEFNEKTMPPWMVNASLIVRADAKTPQEALRKANKATKSTPVGLFEPDPRDLTVSG
jgi:hypothetical protein